MAVVTVKAEEVGVAGHAGLRSGVQAHVVRGWGLKGGKALGGSEGASGK